MMYRDNQPSRRGRLKKLMRNSDILRSNTLTNAFLREERKLEKKLQNLNTEKRLSLTQMDSEIKVYRKINQTKVEKWHDDCDLSDISEAGSDNLDGDDDHDMFDNHYYSTKEKAIQDLREHNCKTLPGKENSSFVRFTPLGNTRKVFSLSEMSKQLDKHSGKQGVCENLSEPPKVEIFFSRRFQKVPQCFEENKSEGDGKPHSTSGTQTQKAKDQHEIVVVDYNSRNRSMSFKQADLKTFGCSHNGEGASGLSHMGGHQASGLSHHMGGHQVSGLSHHMGGHQVSGLSHHMGGHQASGLSHHMGGHQASGLSHHMGGHQASGLSHHMGGHQASGLSHQMGDQARGLFYQTGSQPTNGTPRGMGNHKSTLHIRDLIHTDHHTSGVIYGLACHKSGGSTRGIHCQDSQFKSRTNTVSKFRNIIPADPPAGLTPDSLSDSSHVTSYKELYLKHNPVVSSTSPKQQSNTPHKHHSEWTFQNTPLKHPGISLHNPMLFHPRFHNIIGSMPEENTGTIDTDSFHALRNCRYLRIPQPPSPNSGINCVFDK